MRAFIIITTVFVGLSVAVELAYLRCLAEVRKMHFEMPKRKTAKKSFTRTVFVGRPELDFDLHVRKVDKIRFGDEV